MKTDRNILIAFILNISFSFIEFFGGLFTKSIAIMSDSVHDFGDAITIGISYFLEKKSKTKPDDIYTYGYARYSVLGAIITSLVLLIGSILVLCASFYRLFHPVLIEYRGMIYLSIFGVVVNLLAAFVTKRGDSLNQKAVNLHMLEDVLGWIIVLVGAILMYFTDIRFIDSIMSMGVAVYIGVNAFKNLMESISIMLEKVPDDISVSEIESSILQIDSITGIHHIHIWSTDGIHNFATMHVISDSNSQKIKNEIRSKLTEHNIHHCTIEIENTNEICGEIECAVSAKMPESHNHHHH